MSHELIPRDKACIYWDDIPSGYAPDDVMVLHLEDPERDKKSNRFENSSGALIGDFLKYSSPEQVFREYFETEYLQSLTVMFFDEIVASWAAQFSKIEGFVAPKVRLRVLP